MKTRPHRMAYSARSSMSEGVKYPRKLPAKAVTDIFFAASLNRMKKPELQSPWARWAFVGLSAMWAMGGWMILLAGEFTKTYRYSRHSVWVDGPAAM